MLPAASSVFHYFRIYGRPFFCCLGQHHDAYELLLAGVRDFPSTAVYKSVLVLRTSDRPFIVPYYLFLLVEAHIDRVKYHVIINRPYGSGTKRHASQ